MQTGEPLHSDQGSPRPMRAMNLADSLISRGHSVVIFSSCFYHQEKRHRCFKISEFEINKNLKIILIPSRGYIRNIGFDRLFDHAQLAWHLSKFLKSNILPKPQIAFVGYPPIETASVMLSWLKKMDIPSIIDLKDQWPLLFLEPFPKFLRPIIKLILFPYFYYGRRALNHASSFTTMSHPYLTWMSSFAGRPLNNFDLVVPLTVPKSLFQVNDLIEAEKWWSNLGISTATNRRFCFIGSFMSVFDFTTIRDVALRFQEEGIECQFVICGDGGFASDIRRLMQDLENVIFPGWIDAPKIHVLAKCCSGAIIPYKNIENFTLNTPNKVIDAFAHGLPIITTLKGEVEKLVEKERVGFACNDSTGRTMFDAMKLLLDDQKMRSDMSKRAFSLYESRFSFSKVYGGLVDLLERMAVSDKR